MAVSKAEYQAALDVLHENLPMQLQRQEESGEWKNVGSCVRGKEEAYVKLNSFKVRFPKALFRVVPKNEADKYREGLAMGRKLGPEDEKANPGYNLKAI